jgi:hypothetical protein
MSLPLAPSELSSAQQSLGRALGRARAGEDRDLARKVREKGEALAQLLAGLLAMGRIHAADNRAFEAPLEQLAGALGELVTLLGPVHLAAVEDQVYVNDVRVRAESRGGARDLGTELAKHNVGGLSFHSALDPATLRDLIAVFVREPATVAPRRSLQQALFERGIRSVELSPRFRFRTAEEERVRERDPVAASTRRSCAACARCSTTIATTRDHGATPRSWGRSCGSPRTTPRYAGSTALASRQLTRWAPWRGPPDGCITRSSRR